MRPRRAVLGRSLLRGRLRWPVQVLLGVLAAATGWLWLALLHLLQLEARNRLDGSPGESSPLYLALLGVPAVVLASAACLVTALALRPGTAAADVRRALVTAAVLVLVGLTALVVSPWYLGAMTELVLLPWRALTA